MTPHAQPDPAFREHVSGLIVPAELSRKREVWAKDEWRLVERAVKLMKSRGVSTFYKCDNPACASEPLRLHRDPKSRAVDMRCACKSRLMMSAF